LVERLHTQRAELVACESEVRQAHDEAVHRMRVATRRLRSCLGTFHGAFEIPPTRRLETDLRWLAGRLGAERDAQVISRRIARDVRELTLGHVPDILVETLVSRGAEQVATGHDALIQALDAQRYRSLLGDLDNFVSHVPFRAKQRGRPWMRKQLVTAVQMTQRLTTNAHLLDGAEYESALHEVRKSAKRVRYGAETLVPVYGDRARRVARQFERVQELLGECHDAVVTRGVYRKEGALANVRGNGVGFIYGVLYAREDACAAAAASAFRRAWPRARQSASRSWLSE
jgi:CHAD domain-containing protein